MRRPGAQLSVSEVLITAEQGSPVSSSTGSHSDELAELEGTAQDPTGLPGQRRPAGYNDPKAGAFAFTSLDSFWRKLMDTAPTDCLPSLAHAPCPLSNGVQPQGSREEVSLGIGDGASCQGQNSHLRPLQGSPPPHTQTIAGVLCPSWFSGSLGRGLHGRQCMCGHGQGAEQASVEQERRREAPGVGGEGGQGPGCQVGHLEAAT